MIARDIRYGRRGGRWADKPHDAAALDRWRAERDALADAAQRSAKQAGEQLTLPFDGA